MHNTVTETCLRAPLDPVKVLWNRESLKPRTTFFSHGWITEAGHFSRVPGAKLTKDGYLSLPCQDCQTPVIAYIDADVTGLSAVCLDEGAEATLDDSATCSLCVRYSVVNAA